MNCVVSGHLLSNILGVISSLVWFFVLTPQLYENYLNKNSDAVSLSLIMLWLLGDFLSMFSAQVKSISQVVIYIAIYHIFLGVIFASQIIYYRYYKLHCTNQYVQIFEDTESLSDVSIEYENAFLLSKKEQVFVVSSICIICFVKFYFNMNLPGTFILADIVAWVTTLIFVVSRIPQIQLNFVRKTTDGLSMYSFIMLNIANYLFLASLLVNVCDASNINLFLLNNLQWILGAVCTSFLDIVIFYQFWLYSDKA
jgi:uncharacterized protein with PQ loop repeat